MEGTCTAHVITVPLLADNYAYLLVDRATGNAAAIDPAEPDKILAVAAKHDVNIQTVLCTHKHWDHAGGNEAMARKLRRGSERILGLEVVGSAYEEIPAMTHSLGDGQEYRLGELSIRALHAPCHTRGHVLFYVTRVPAAGESDSGDAAGESGGGDAASDNGGFVAGCAPLLFCGDTLFVGGCGRFFEGDGADMARALLDVVAKLPRETRVFCGHEYTVSN
ncbi:unnamed protein product, partial [Phaeothamnion confervicola]